jgi:hypothetical protein
MLQGRDLGQNQVYGQPEQQKRHDVAQPVDRQPARLAQETRSVALATA